MQIYRHKQVGRLLIWALVVGTFVLAGVASRIPGGTVPAIVILVVMLGTMPLYTTLGVSVSDDELRIWFGPGLFHKHIRVADIVDARAVRNPWWYGWGIHLTPNGWLWNVEGLDAVELSLTNDRKFRVGTDEPSRLLGAIRQAKGSR